VILPDDLQKEITIVDFELHPLMKL